jgi:hypothetical protein
MKKQWENSITSGWAKEPGRSPKIPINMAYNKSIDVNTGGQLNLSTTIKPAL